MNIKKQIDYWKTGSKEDIEAAKSLLQKKHYRHALYFAHLALEKMLKAFVVRQTNTQPPYIHNLVRLSILAKQELDDDQLEFLRYFDVYQLEGRYPEYLLPAPDKKTCVQELERAERMLQWLMNQF